jgi:hypothetical protein
LFIEDINIANAVYTGISETFNLLKDIEIYPNPFNEGFMLNAEAKQYRLIDMFGRIVLQGEIVSESQWINTEFISSGIYFLELDQLEIQRKRVVKIK